jgi:DNA polymerase III epsilon subunit-like protein
MSKLIELGKQIVSDAPQLYIDVDVEADGKAGYGSLLSIGAVTPEGDSYYVELKPGSDDYIVSQREFCENHALERERLLREGVEPRTAIDEFTNWTNLQAEKHGKRPVFAAFNAAFDFALIDLECARSGIKNPYGVAPFCLKSLAQAINPSWDWTKTGKNNLPPEILPGGDFTHHALEDAIYQQHIHYGLAGLLNRNKRSD